MVISLVHSQSVTCCDILDSAIKSKWMMERSFHVPFSCKMYFVRHKCSYLCQSRWITLFYFVKALHVKNVYGIRLSFCNNTFMLYYYWIVKRWKNWRWFRFMVHKLIYDKAFCFFILYFNNMHWINSVDMDQSCQLILLCERRVFFFNWFKAKFWQHSLLENKLKPTKIKVHAQYR